MKSCENNPFLNWVVPGHFYSPIPSLDEIKNNQSKIFSIAQKEILGINLNSDQQISLLEKFKLFYQDFPFSEDNDKQYRYYLDNDFYSYGDAIILYSFIRHIKPNRIIEIGSGFSSALILDVNEHFLNNEMDCTFIEPFPERLLTLLKSTDSSTLIVDKVQNVDIEKFTELKENDFLIIDSSHVSKIGSDVNHLIFNILPKLNNGVYIHFHDIFFPFEYPESWILEGRCWNEAYLLKAFLQYNHSYEIVFWSNYLDYTHRSELQESLPLTEKFPGCSIWIKKTK